MANDDDLGLVATGDMIDALLRRCDHGVVVLLQDRTERGHHVLWRRWRGNPHINLGVLADLSDLLITEIRQRESDVSDEDE